MSLRERKGRENVASRADQGSFLFSMLLLDSGYDDSVHDGESYSGYSNWDTYRGSSRELVSLRCYFAFSFADSSDFSFISPAEWPWLILFAPERVLGMITSMLQDYREGGWLPM